MNIKDVGFTGTPDGMTERQSIMFAVLLEETEGDQFHHGDCMGAALKLRKLPTPSAGKLSATHPRRLNIKRIRRFIARTTAGSPSRTSPATGKS